jgi:AMP nucleosidase
MSRAPKTSSPSGRKTTTATQTFTDAQAALDHAGVLYEEAVRRLRKALQGFISGRQFHSRVRECYPSVRVSTQTVARADSRLTYGFVAGPGVYETTLTRPDLFGGYYREQFALLLRNHRVALEVGPSSQPIPVHFSLADTDHLEGTLSAERRLLMRDLFDLPDLAAMDDGIANGTHEPGDGRPQPLSLFTAPRVDYSLHRLRHYTGTAPEHFQNFVLFTNYQFYIDEFIRLGREQMAAKKSDYATFVEPGDVITRRAARIRCQATS